MADPLDRLLLLNARLHRVMTDRRFEDGRPLGGQLRFYIVALHWAEYACGQGTDAMNAEARRILGWLDGADRSRIGELIGADVPRYEPPAAWRPGPLGCCAPIGRGPRAGQPCGVPAVRSFQVHRPNGEWDLAGWCRPHLPAAEQAWRRERSVTGWPEPRPNVGGLLPAHVIATNWPELYEQAQPGWQPPGCGINADDWPGTGPVLPEMVRPLLRLVVGDGQQATGLPPAALRPIR